MVSLCNKGSSVQPLYVYLTIIKPKLNLILIPINVAKDDFFCSCCCLDLVSNIRNVVFRGEFQRTGV